MKKNTEDVTLKMSCINIFVLDMINILIYPYLDRFTNFMFQNKASSHFCLIKQYSSVVSELKKQTKNPHTLIIHCLNQYALSIVEHTTEKWMQRQIQDCHKNELIRHISTGKYCEGCAAFFSFMF